MNGALIMSEPKKRVLLFGAGTLGVKLLQNLPSSMEAIGFVDNDPAKQGTTVSGIEVLKPGDILTTEFDYIVLASSFVARIVDQLMALGVSKKALLCLNFSNIEGRGWLYDKNEYREFYRQQDAERLSGDKVSPELLERYVHGIDFHPEIDLIWELNRISMLSPQVLLLLRFLAIVAKGRVLDIGPYIGGSTIAICSGLKAAGKSPVISIESGGSYPNHPDIPSSDIFQDLLNNIDRFGYQEYVCLLRGWSNDAHIEKAVHEELGEEKIGLFFIDADGNVERDFRLYGRYFMDGCLIVLDDYTSDMAQEKEVLVKKWVDQMLDRGILEQLGVFPWGTWFGRLKKNIWAE